MSKQPIRLGCSLLSKRIYAGILNKAGTTWLPGKTDVTGEACAAVAEHVLAMADSNETGEITLSADGKDLYKIVVEKLK